MMRYLSDTNISILSIIRLDFLTRPHSYTCLKKPSITTRILFSQEYTCIYFWRSIPKMNKTNKFIIHRSDKCIHSHVYFSISTQGRNLKTNTLTCNHGYSYVCHVHACMFIYLCKCINWLFFLSSSHKYLLLFFPSQWGMQKLYMRWHPPNNEEYYETKWLRWNFAVYMWKVNSSCELMTINITYFLCFFHTQEHTSACTDARCIFLRLRCCMYTHLYAFKCMWNHVFFCLYCIVCMNVLTHHVQQMWKC